MDGSPNARLPDRRTKLVATLGPASAGVIDDLVQAGLDVARVNLSHGSPEEHRAAAAAVRSAAARASRPVALLVDLPGPKLRLGQLKEAARELEAGMHVTLAAQAEADGLPDGLPLRDPGVLPRLLPGDRILLADGAAECRVVSAGERRVRAEVVRGGLVRSRAGVNVPAERLPQDAVGSPDEGLLPHLLALEPDYVGQSFVRSAADVRALRGRLPSGTGLVAKIETRPAVEAISAILRVADAIMVARGDLGVELPFQDVPLVQKDLVTAALAAGRPSIVATQMLESMVEAPRPTRAEASDVANAVLDGADAVMLSAETAIGAWPLEALAAAAAICERADAYLGERRSGAARGPTDRLDPDDRALSLAAAAIADADPAVVALACFTRTGRTARLLSALRPRVPILAFTPAASVVSSLALWRGVVARLMEEPADPTTVGAAVRASLVTGSAGWAIVPGRAVVLVASSGPGPGPDLVEVIRA